MRKISNQLRKIQWFIKNYRTIQPGKTFLPEVFHGPITYQADGLITSNNCDFISEPRFRTAYAAAERTNPWGGFNIPWRVYIVCWFADMVKGLDGDFVECGVNTGAYARAIIDYTSFNTLGKNFFLLDTYQGLVESQITEKEFSEGVGTYLDNYRDVYNEVVETFRSFPVKIVRGKVPDTLPQCTAEKICYLSIDMNVVAPEIAAARFFWDKLVPGAVMILDDYGFPKHIEQKKAFDQFANEKGVSILSLPTGQAIIFKP